MAYREVNWMEVDEVVRRAAAGESQRSIAHALGLARNTVASYVRGARSDAPSAVRPRRPPGPRPGSATPEMDRLRPYTDQIATWLKNDHLQLTRIQALRDAQRRRDSATWQDVLRYRCEGIRLHRVGKLGGPGRCACI